MLNRLETDKSLAVFAGQFVPLKIITDGSEEWSTWSRKYPVDTKGIPILYVVRADGEKLYGKSGSLRGAALPQMLTSVLQKSGKSLSDAELALVKGSVEAAKSAVAREEFGKAAAEISKLSKVGGVGDLKSFSSYALEADELAKKLVEGSTKLIEDASAKIDNPETIFAGVLALTQLEQQFDGFGTVRLKLVSATKEAKKDKTRLPLFKQAEAIVRARQLAASTRAAISKNAPVEYEKVIRRYPGTEADKIAREELLAISPNSKILTETPTPSKAIERTWTDRTGKFKIRATLIRVADGKVTLKKANGQEITLAIEKLGAEDQKIANSNADE